MKKLMLSVWIGTLSVCDFAHARPNIVLIVIDNVGYEAFGAYGERTMYSTPHIDQLAREGMVFTRMYSQPMCSQSRLQIFTGRHLYRATTAPQTLGHVMQNAGYKTLLRGSGIWSHGGRPVRQGSMSIFL